MKCIDNKNNRNSQVFALISVSALAILASHAALAESQLPNLTIDPTTYSDAYDTTATNLGDGPRLNESVDTQIREYGNLVGWVRAGEWLDYDVVFPQSGNYQINIDLASPYDGKGILTLSLEDLQQTLGNVTPHLTGSWFAFDNYLVSNFFSITAGTHRLRLKVDDSIEPRFNIGNIQFKLIEEPQSTHTIFKIPAQIIDPTEYSDYHDSDIENKGNGPRTDEGVDTQLSTYGQSVGWVQPAETLTYEIKITNGGFYTLAVDMASIYGGGLLELSLGENQRLGEIESSNTGDWFNFETLTTSTPVELIEGKHQLTLTVSDRNFSEFNIGRIFFLATSSTTPPSQPPTPQPSPTTEMADCEQDANQARYPENKDLIWACGMKVWRQESNSSTDGNTSDNLGRGDDRNGSRCVECHGPDPLEFALIKYDDNAQTFDPEMLHSNMFMDRAMHHIKENDARWVLKLVEAMRIEYEIDTKDAFGFRCLQPNNEVFGMRQGEQDHNFSSADGDYAFGEALAQKFRFASEQVNESNHAAIWQEMLSLNIRDLPVGIPFSHWSHDRRRGDDHRSFADFIPESSSDFSDPERMFSAQDKYLNNPTDENLMNYLNQSKSIDHRLMHEANNAMNAGKGITLSSGGTTARVPRAKYSAVQLCAHSMRLEILDRYKQNHAHWPNIPGFTASDNEQLTPIAKRTDLKSNFPNQNGIWDVASFFRDFGRDYGKGNCKDNWTLDGCEDSSWLLQDMTSELANSLAGTPTPFEDGRHTLLKPSVNSEMLRAPWFWMGWLIDPSLYHTHGSNDYPVVAAEYFMEQLMEGGRIDTEQLDTQGQFQRIATGGYPIHAALMMGKRNIDLIDRYKMGEDFDYNSFPFVHPDFRGTRDYACDYTTSQDGLSTTEPNRILSGQYPIAVGFSEKKTQSYSSAAIDKDPGNNLELKRYQNLAGFSSADAKRLAHQKIYQRITANMYRLFLYQMKTSLVQGDSICHKKALLSKISQVKHFLDVANIENATSAEASASDRSIIDDLVCKLIPSAKEKLEVFFNDKVVTLNTPDTLSESEYFSASYLKNLESNLTLPECQ